MNKNAEKQGISVILSERSKPSRYLPSNTLQRPSKVNCSVSDISHSRKDRSANPVKLLKAKPERILRRWLQ